MLVSVAVIYIRMSNFPIHVFLGEEKTDENSHLMDDLTEEEAASFFW